MAMNKLTIFWVAPFTFAARGRHSWLLPKATTSLKSRKPIFAAGGRHIHLWPEATILSKSHVPKKIGTHGQLTLIIHYLRGTIKTFCCWILLEILYRTIKIRLQSNSLKTQLYKFWNPQILLLIILMMLLYK